MSAVRTRFAPSPTGYMHIGGMRTALFNWLWARHTGGSFILRIDDTDRERNVDEALAPILQAFRWLGLDWDEGPEVGGDHGPYFQSQRGHFYSAALEKLLAEGKAFRDYDPPELTQQDRQAAEKEKRTFLNVRRSLDLSESELAQYAEENRPHVVRLLVPRDRKVAVDDIVRGHVEWDCGQIADPVICRADGSPLYNFATVVDDSQLEISHVIRAEEHLTNTAVQLLIYEALEQSPPLFAHVPFVAAPGTKQKLSKREKSIEKYRKNPQFQKLFDAADWIFPQIGLGSSETLNPVMVAYYEEIGFLPEAVFNALSRLGWSLDDHTEILSRETVVENFTLDRVVNSPAGLDPDKLISYQQHWIGELSLEEKIDGVWPFLQRSQLAGTGRLTTFGSEEEQRKFVAQVIEAMGERLKLFSDIFSCDYFFVSDDQLAYDDKAFAKRVAKEGTAPLLEAYRQQLAEVETWEAATLEQSMKGFCEDRGIKLGEIIHAVRVSITGQAQGPGMFECVELLGRESCLNRIDRALQKIA